MRTVLDADPVQILDETFSSVAKLSPEMDTFLRFLAVRFFDDICRNTFTPSLFDDATSTLPDRLDTFNSSSPGSVPVRFTDFDTVSVEELRNNVVHCFGITTAPSDPCLPQPRQSSWDELNPGRPKQQVRGAGDSSDNKDLEQLSATAHESMLGQSSLQRKNRAEAECSAEGEIPASFLQARETVWTGLYDYIHMHNCNFTELADAYNADEEQVEAFGDTQLVLIDPPYNIRREDPRDNADCDHLLPTDISKVVQLVDDLLRSAGHAIVMFFVQQFPVW